MLSGYCNNVTSNSGHIYRQLAGSSGYETVDGEGILHQSQNGNPGYGDWIVNNDLSGGESGYIGKWTASFFDICVTCAYRSALHRELGPCDPKLYYHEREHCES